MSKEQIQRIDRELLMGEISGIVEDFSDAVDAFNERSESEYSTAWQLGVYQSVLMQMLEDNAKLRKQLKRKTKDINNYSTD
tara:strand:- start:619 stop:861 length:243 start_codon:yes stop_codon:yes gene_type:complete